tara:strand:+ start:487 stop:729 length:243 start_codon:yes stop_codon:yes gene_type:complete
MGDTITAIAEEQLEYLMEKLSEAIDAAERVAQTAGGIVESQMEVYMIPHLRSWLEDDHQPGSVPSIFRSLQEQAEDEDAS